MKRVTLPPLEPRAKVVEGVYARRPMGYRYKLVTLDPELGDIWPKYARYDSWSYRGDVEAEYRDIRNGDSMYATHPEEFKANYLTELAGQLVGSKIRAIVLDEDPEVNEWGEVSP